MITKAERSELRSLIRQRFKVLRADIEARRAELKVELEERINAKFAADDKAWSDAMFLIDEVKREANRKVNDIIRGLNLAEYGYDPDREYDAIIIRQITKPTKTRTSLHAEGEARINAQVKGALLELDRQEADLLTRLVVDALESAEAQRFLAAIPTVSALVPADRLLAIVGPIEPETT